ncbi:MAG: hypothetical protein BHV87_14735, partial [Clostridiales bacterium 36_14]
WEQRKFGNVTELKSASRVHKEEWTTSGVPFYRSSDVMAAINGTENEKAYISEALYEKLSSISGKLEAGDVLVTGGGSVGKPYIVPNNEPLYTKDADLLWIKNQGKFHPYFLYEFFFTPTFRSYLSSISHVGTIAHYTITQLSETPICLPSVGEQQKIGDYFYNIDHLITLHQRKCEETKKLKKYMLQKMFPQNGKRVPEIRFAGFTDDWEQRKLGDIFEEYSEKKHSELPALTIIQGKGTIKREESDRNLMYDKSKLDGYKMVRKNDFIVHLRSFEGGLEKASSDGIISPAYHTFHGKNIDSRFYYPYFRSYEFIKRKLIAHVYGIRDGRSIDISGMKTIKIPYTSYMEQVKIGDYLDQLDYLITLHQRKYEELQKIKKFMLQNMFI